jgi:AcrR family transcriptional regulator
MASVRRPSNRGVVTHCPLADCDTVDGTLTERKKQRTWEQLVEVAHVRFLAQGFDRTTIEEIASIVEVSPRTVHRYFPTKEDLFLAHGQVSWSMFLSALRERPAEETILSAVTRAIAVAFGDGWSDGPRVRALLTVVEASPALQARWHQQSQAFQADLADVLAGRAGRRCHVLADLVAAGAVSATIITAMREWAVHGGERPLMPLVERAMAVLANPLLPA